jgi:hypothetical protein
VLEAKLKAVAQSRVRDAAYLAKFTAFLEHLGREVKQWATIICLCTVFPFIAFRFSPCSPHD